MNLTFDRYELTYLEMVLAPSEIAVECNGDSFLPKCIPTKRLCMAIGSAWMEALASNNEVGIALTEQDLWILRERVNLGATIGQERVGQTIKTKLYQALQAVEVKLATGMETISYQEPSYKEVTDALEKRDADAHKDGPEDGAPANPSAPEAL